LRCDDRKSGGVTACRNFNARATSHDRNRTMDNRHKVYNRRDARQPLTALTALCLGQTMFGFRNDAKQYASCVRSRLVELGEPFLHLRLTTQKRYDCSAAFPCTEVLCTNSTSARLYFLNVLYWRTLVRSDRADFTRPLRLSRFRVCLYFCSNIMTHMH
jgi:hypothetical protein